jgi:hypothetical protein
VPPNGSVWSSVEVHFHISGTVNKQNFRYWYALSTVGIVGPYFFEEGGVTVTVISNRYCEMLENFIRPKIEEYENTCTFRFQQDGSTTYTARCSRAVL